MNAGRGAVSKTAVVAAVERNGDVIAVPVDRTDKETLQGFVRSNVAPGSMVMTDESASYRSLSAAGLTGFTGYEVGKTIFYAIVKSMRQDKEGAQGLGLTAA